MKREGGRTVGSGPADNLSFTKLMTAFSNLILGMVVGAVLLQRSVAISFEGESCKVCGSRDLLKELIENLSQNAIRYNNPGGTGPGLAIVKHIVEIHDAKIELDSTPGVGNTMAETF